MFLLYEQRLLQRYCERVKSRWGITAIQIYIHRDDQSTAIKMVMMNFSPNDKSVWQKIGAWLLHLAKELGHLSANAVRRIADELTSVADGRYDWRIDRFMRNNGMSR